MIMRTRTFGVLVVMALLSAVSGAEWKSAKEPGVALIWTSTPPDKEFSIECRHGRLKMDIMRGHAQGHVRERPDLGEYRAQVAFDGGPSRRLHLRETDGPIADSWQFAAVDQEEHATLIRDLRVHQRMTVMLVNRGGRGTTTLEFDVRGFEKAFAPLKSCRIPAAGGRR
jgi:hypothetical protein